MKTSHTKATFSLLALSFALTSPAVWASEKDECVAQGIQAATGNTSIADIRQRCQAEQQKMAGNHDAKRRSCLRERAVTASDSSTADTIKAECEKMVSSGKYLPEKFVQSRTLEANPYMLMPLRQNYILPYTYNNDPNQEPYQLSGDEELVDNQEAKLQISLKVPLTFTDLLLPNDGIYFGFTLKSFWQVYNDEISAPFRETNYRPEVFYQTPLPINGGDGVWFGRAGFEHESNGRTQYLSRSWNRAYVTLGYAGQDWAVNIQPWYRLPEDEKYDDGNPDTPPESKGDDNPDIDDYMGQYEVTAAYQWRSLEFSGMFRRNFSEGKGAHELGMSFPLWGRLLGYVQYFEGYGESMIDYNHKNQRIGVGVLLTDLL